LSQGGWINTYGIDVNVQNLGLGFTHAVSLSVNGTILDTFTAIPQNAGTYLHDVVPIVVASGAVIRVTLTVTQTSNNIVYWFQQVGLFATPPTYCSLAVGSKDGAAAGTTAYGLHTTFIPGTASPDWYVVAFGGSAVPGEGAGGGIADAPSDGNLYGRLNAAWSLVAVGSAVLPLMDGIAAVGTGTAWARGDHVHPTDTSLAPLASPALTGTPTAPNVIPANDNTTKIANTAFVQSAITAAIGGTGYATSTPGASAPVSPKAGDFWWYDDTANPGGGVLYMWYTDPTSSQWVAVSTGNGVPDAPSDGSSYVRNNGAWVTTIDAGTF
jgi:hypothetical protein